MAEQTIRLRPSVSRAPDAGGDFYADPLVVGDPATALADGSDSTYARAYSAANASFNGSTGVLHEPIYLLFPAITDLSSIETLTFGARWAASARSTDGADLGPTRRVMRGGFWHHPVGDVASGDQIQTFGSDLINVSPTPNPFLVEGTIYESAAQILPASWFGPGDFELYEPQYRAALTDEGLGLHFFAANQAFGTPAWNGTGWIYEAWLDVTYQAGQSPVRQWPRDDGLGISSSVRRYPPPKAGRRIGGYR